MRFKPLLLWDMKFQTRYGFYLLYGFLTVFYLVLLLSLPLSWKENAAAILIYSDPAAMGLFFMGAIILLEKSQRVTSFFAVSPLRVIEYVCSKVLSLSAIGMLVATILAVATNCRSLPLLLLGTFLSSVMFTLSGVIIATKITSLNQFILATVPVEIIAFVPAVLHLFKMTPACLRIYPANVCMDLIAGRDFSLMGFILAIVLIVVLFVAAYKCVGKMWQNQGGVKL
ncbi:MAG: ABC transporter permease [Lachnospiraceae bacterium]|nr:ABC transporter permease [Lachnospiraceae bacterium]